MVCLGVCWGGFAYILLLKYPEFYYYSISYACLVLCSCEDGFLSDSDLLFVKCHIVI